ncbi:MAG TPA: hypothetical protein VNF48_03245 [Gammaproteobacteria bacterium]|nr:hypothetical protein [Gammaproteobacteria bacterium]
MAKHSWLLIAAWLFATAAFATDQKPVQTPPKVDPELLEFLGSWQGSDDVWVDPMTFARIDPGKLADDKTRQEGKPTPPVKVPPPKHAGDWEQST